MGTGQEPAHNRDAVWNLQSAECDGGYAFKWKRLEKPIYNLPWDRIGFSETACFERTDYGTQFQWRLYFVCGLCGRLSVPNWHYTDEGAGIFLHHLRSGIQGKSGKRLWIQSGDLCGCCRQCHELSSAARHKAGDSESDGSMRKLWPGAVVSDGAGISAVMWAERGIFCGDGDCRPAGQLWPGRIQGERHGDRGTGQGKVVDRQPSAGGGYLDRHENGGHRGDLFSLCEDHAGKKSWTISGQNRSG